MIKISNLSYKYKEGNIGLSNINLEINRGEVVMIIGTNGSGKSTLLSAIANLIKYDGSITLDDKEIRKIKNKEFRKRVGIVFQNPNIQVVFNNVYDDIKFTLENLDIDDIDKHIDDALALVNMTEYRDSNPYNLSMGQRQRIALASILSSDKEYLLLDEVTSMIDYNGKQEIYKIIEKLKKKNVGIIMTTNIIDELLYADKIVIINDNHEIKGIYKKKDIFDNLDLLKDFYIPFKFKLINKIGFNKIKDFSDKELLKYVNK